MAETAPPNVKKHVKSCAACDRDDEASDQVACDLCDRWFHYDCVGVTDTIQDQPWTCDECFVKQASSDAAEAKAEKTLQMELAEIQRKHEELLYREKEKMKLKLRLEKEMIQKRKEMEGEFAKLYSQLQEEYSSENYQTPVHPKVKQATSLFAPSPAEVPRTTNAKPKPAPSQFASTSQSVPRSDQFEITKAQLAARKGPFSKLPTFTGRPEEWPMFISSFNAANEACNYSNLENLGRLQESLKGNALEAVRSRLLLPECVPKVIETLRLLYGRPEQLLHTLINKAREAEPPRMERLHSFVQFGMIVQQLCDHLVASEMKEHLVNPMLITELVNKLPNPTKLEWVKYKRQHPTINLTTFSDFVAELVSEVTEATLYIPPPAEHQKNSNTKRTEKKQKPTVEQGFLHTHIGIEQPTTSTAKAYPEAKNETKRPCRQCGSTAHRLRNCEAFRKLAWDDKMKLVEKWQICKQCLNEHGKTRCWFKGSCKADECKESHHIVLHPPKDVEPIKTDCLVHNDNNSPVIFRVVPIKIYNQEQAIETLAFLDEGSSYSLIENSLAEKLNLKGSNQPITINWTAGMSREERDSKCLTISVSAKNNDERLVLNNVHTVKRLQLPEQKLSIKHLVASFKHLQNIPVAETSETAPRVLIGLKHLHVYAPIEARIGQPGEPIAVKSKLGWTIYGPRENNNNHQTAGFTGHHFAKGTSNEDLQELLRKHFAFEESPEVTIPESEEDRRARELLRETTVRVGDRFETGLLWKTDNPKLPDSLPMALKRMRGLERKLVKNPEHKRNVDSQIAEYVRKEYAHIAKAEELAEAEPGRIWYLPLNYVINPKKPGKTRLVWDAAAAANGISLNDMLLKGPDLLASLPSVLCPFRERPIGFGGDIAEMYHQVKIRKRDKYAQMFLYRHDQSTAPVTYIMDVATFGSTSSPCSAQYVKNLNASEFRNQYPDAVDAIVRKHYVDDYMDSAFTIDEAIKRAGEVAYIQSKAGFILRKWVSNSSEFTQHFGETQTEKVINIKCDKTESVQRVLGMSWNTENDKFQYVTDLRQDLQPYLHEENIPSKRIVLSIVMSFFDPLGLWSLFTIFGKMIIQDLWRNGCTWDESIDDKSVSKWNNWIALIPRVQSMQIPRCYFSEITPSEYEDLELHIFADASEEAYGCVAYFRIVTNGQAKVALVSAKAKVAPLQYMSIPRMELLAAVLAAKMSDQVKANHSVKVKRLVIHIDSTTVLAWIRSDHRKYKQFVAYRIGEILCLTSPEVWRWVPTKDNIADVLTKWGNNGPPLESGGRWIQGPEFLYRPEEEWPHREIPAANVKEELRAYHLFHDITQITNLVDTTRFSRWNVMVRSIACVFRFLSNCQKLVKKMPIETIPSTPKIQKMIKTPRPAVKIPLKTEEYRQAENYLWRLVQQEAFPDEVKTLRKNQELPQHQQHSIERTSFLHRLCPLMDDFGVIRMEGRSAYAEFISFEQRFPIILPKEHDVTHKLILHYHRKFGHANRETVVNELRQRFYIRNIRSAVIMAIKNCVWCKVKKCQPTTPRMAPLPTQRITPQLRPFSYVGVDYFGPVTVTIGRRSEKRWISLFTCLTTRAIHMEVAYDLTSQSCIMAIRRFICRRGAPKEFFSDNGTNFIAASKELTREVRRIDMDCADTFSDARTKWNFNPPAAPHMGGVWERLVRSAKEALKALHDGGQLTDEILATVITEAEDMVNSRPLTYIPQESADTEALTPNHFLRGLPADEKEESHEPTDPAEALQDRFKRSQQLADMLWERWLKEYIPTINHRTKWHEDREMIQVGDLVYVADGANRRTWLRGKVDRVIEGVDGRVRQAIVKTSKGLFKRAVAKLAKMEV